MLGDTLLLAGDRAGAIALFERGLAAARQSGHGGLPAALRRSAGRRHRLAAMLGEAAGLLEQASIPDGGAWMLGLRGLPVARARPGWRTDEPDRARAVLAPLLAVADREPWIPALAAALAADGRALIRLGRPSRPGPNWTGPPGSPQSTACRTCCATPGRPGAAAIAQRISRSHGPASPCLLLSDLHCSRLQRHCNAPAQPGRDGGPNDQGEFHHGYRQ